MSDTLTDQEQAQQTEIIDALDEIGKEPAEETEEKEKRSDSREYIVFQEGNTGTWVEIGRHVASNAGAAMLAAQGDSPKEGPRFAATPSRNWTVAKPKVKVETSVTLEYE